MIQQTVVRVVYKGDGVTKEFPIHFPVLSREFIVVCLSDKNGNEKTLNKDYYVDMDKRVVLYPGYVNGQEPAEAEQPPVLQTGEKIVIYRNTQVSQLVSLGHKWPFEVCEKALDKLTMIEQENKESIARTVRLAGTTENVRLILPLPEKETAIGWSDDEKSIINIPVKQWQKEAAQAAGEAKGYSDAAAVVEESVRNHQRKAEEQAELARKWAENETSPDNQDDEESITGKTRSSKAWAVEARTEKDRAESEAQKAKVEADRALANSTRAEELKT